MKVNLYVVEFTKKHASFQVNVFRCAVVVIVCYLVHKIMTLGLKV